MLSFGECYIRPLNKEDLELVLSWRNSERVRLMMYNQCEITWQEHVDWFARIEQGLVTTQPYIFVHQSKPLGLASISDIDADNNRCSWGFYIGEAHAPSGSGLAMGYLVLQHIFETLDIHKIYSEVLGFNRSSVNYHEKLGFIKEGLLKEHVLINGKYIDVVTLALFSKKWYQNKRNLLYSCFAEVGS